MKPNRDRQPPLDSRLRLGSGFRPGRSTGLGSGPGSGRYSRSGSGPGHSTGSGSCPGHSTGSGSSPKASTYSGSRPRASTDSGSRPRPWTSTDSGSRPRSSTDSASLLQPSGSCSRPYTGSSSLLGIFSSSSSWLPREASSYQEGRVLRIENLSKSITKARIRELFSVYGKIIDVALPMDDNGGIIFEGVAFVTFKNNTDARITQLCMNNITFEGNQMKVDFQTSSPRQKDERKRKREANPTASPKKSLVAQRVGSSGRLANSSPRRRIARVVCIKERS